MSLPHIFITAKASYTQEPRNQNKSEEALEENFVDEIFAPIDVLYEHPETHIYLLQLRLPNYYKFGLHETNDHPKFARNLDNIKT